MEYDTVKNYIIDKLSSFIVQNDLEILYEEDLDSYGFTICIGNDENYLYIFYGIHIYPYPFEMIVRFGKRAYVKDKDFKYVAMKPHYSINDFAEDLNLEIEIDFQKDQKLLDKICDLIPEVFTIITNQTEEYFIDHCTK